MRRIVALYQGDSLRENRNVATKNTIDILVCGYCATFLTDKIGVDKGRLLCYNTQALKGCT